MKPYADTNLLVRVYLGTPGTAEARRLFNLAHEKGAERIPMIWLHRFELMNALELAVWFGRRGKHHAVTPQQAALAWSAFVEDLDQGSFLERRHLEENALGVQFEQFSRRHTAKRGFRTYDVLHVAAACLLGCDEFWSFDQRAQELATLEGLRVPAECRS